MIIAQIAAPWQPQISISHPQGFLLTANPCLLCPQAARISPIFIFYNGLPHSKGICVAGFYCYYCYYYYYWRLSMSGAVYMPHSSSLLHVIIEWYAFTQIYRIICIHSVLMAIQLRLLWIRQGHLSIQFCMDIFFPFVGKTHRAGS